MSPDFKKGDRVRVTLEGTVVGVFDLGDDSLELKIEPADNLVQYISTKTHAVEKIEPEVEVFGPGDVVRRRGVGDDLRALAATGYTNLGIGTFYEWGDVRASYKSIKDFTSEHYERVEVG